MKRRDIIRLGATSPIIGLTLPSKLFQPNNKLKGKVNHSVCRWCYNSIPLAKLVDDAQELGLKSIELLDLSEIKLITQKGLTCAIANGSKLGITKGFNDSSNHSKLFEDYSYLLPRLSELGISQVICFSGNKNSKSNAEGIENCAKGLDPVVKLAQKYNIKVVMELLNSKVDHHDYHCDHTDWGVSLVEKLGSPNFSLLYDIYHMQIMEGDIISTITQNSKYISHFHTGGVPGRNEINETQELNYKRIIEAIIGTGFSGYIAQEFIPTRQDLIASLREGINICDI